MTPDERAVLLRRAHTEVWRLRQAKAPIPFRLRVLEAEYQARVRKPRPRPEGLLAGIRHDEAVRRATAA